MIPENPEFLKLQERIHYADYDQREPTLMELEEKYRDYCASQEVYLLNPEQMGKYYEGL